MADIVAAAIAALQCFGDVDRATADRLLGMWAHRARLSAAGRQDVLGHFPARAPAAAHMHDRQHVG